jgi:transcriptional regulator with GAF, ATPase, and Fis domain
VIFLTSLSDTEIKLRAFKAGAVDYVTKPFQTDELLARVGTHISLRREIEAHRKSRSTIQYLVEEIRAERHSIVGDSPALRHVLQQIAQVAPTDSTVLVLGETGTGKELVARAIHEAGARRDRALVKLNCAALPRELVESELFGHEKGAFTGAVQQRRGRFEAADGGTLFLDEVGELPLEAQAKLLRVLQEREFERVGGSRTLRVDVRVIAATNRDLRTQVATGRFRDDLFYRLNVFPIPLPALRERRADIPRLVQHFASKSARKLGRELQGIAPSFMECATAYDWPGNIRELENLVERAMIMSRGPVLDGSALFTPATSASKPITVAGNGTLEEIERAHIRRVLEDTRWQIEGEHGAARVLGLNPSTLRGRLRKLGIRKAS